MASFTVPTHTEVANTAIVDFIPGRPGWIPRVRSVAYRTDATEHTITIMRPVADTVVFKTAASGQNDIELDSIFPGLDSSGSEESLATSDYLAWIDSAGQYQWGEVSTVNGTIVTLTTSLSRSIRTGSPVFVFYELGRDTHYSLSPVANSFKEYTGLCAQAGFPASVDRWNGPRSGAGDPLLLYSNNITDAGTLEHASGLFIHESVLSRT